MGYKYSDTKKALAQTEWEKVMGKLEMVDLSKQPMKETKKIGKKVLEVFY